MAISYPSNLESINVNALNTRDSDKYFNNFFNIPPVVSSNVDAAIVAYFEQITTNAISARALASAVIYTSAKQGVDPMDTLREFQKMPKGELAAYTALFLNLERVGTSFLGISNQPKLNKYIARAILP
ncbi:hypothetical protein UFOVP257_36 [uncultured Caudovirales phage]|uniref:Uncharacterized protein n=1 Tax=uncultured Caudovirales phage TaxID=2100421 RepID=A0A6J5LIT4_9CAUD|nr:hypothetical protein UFOVP257_36 [uncultured Caudovirales phage]